MGSGTQCILGSLDHRRGGPGEGEGGDKRSLDHSMGMDARGSFVCAVAL